MPSQEEADFVAESGSQAQETSRYTVGSNFIVNLLMSGSMSQIWGVIEGIQIVSYLPLYDAKIPGNVQSFLNFFDEMTSFEVLPAEEWTDELLYSPESVPP